MPMTYPGSTQWRPIPQSSSFLLKGRSKVVVESASLGSSDVCRVSELRPVMGCNIPTFLAHLSRHAHKVSIPMLQRPSVGDHSFSQKLLGQPKPQWEGGTEVYINDPGHMTKMAAKPIYVKNLLQNWMYDLETCHVAAGTRALQSLYKLWSWVDLDLFYGKVKFGHIMF